jgi:hypothetical protein
VTAVAPTVPAAFVGRAATAVAVEEAVGAVVGAEMVAGAETVASTVALAVVPTVARAVGEGAAIDTASAASSGDCGGRSS